MRLVPARVPTRDQAVLIKTEVEVGVSLHQAEAEDHPHHLKVEAALGLSAVRAEAGAPAQEVSADPRVHRAEV